MTDRQSRNQSGSEVEARREFLKNVGKMTATAPAVALLLAASTKSASARSQYLPGDECPGDADGDSGDCSSLP